MSHPSETILALWAAGDLGFWRSLRIRRHVTGCAHCRREAGAFETALNALRQAAGEMPDEVQWNRLAPEMKGNIRVGLVADECVAPPAVPETRLAWRTAATLAAVVAVMVAGWLLQPPRPRPEGIVLEATDQGIELRQGDRALGLRHPNAGDVTYSVSGQGVLRARYVDTETGQVTIQNVYAQ